MRRYWLRASAFGALLVHGCISYVAWLEHGFAGAFPPFVSSNTTQIYSDLVIALIGVNIWVFYDMRLRKTSRRWFVVHATGTWLSGSFAPLLYILFRRPTP
jgi:hypothetical protein